MTHTIFAPINERVMAGDYRGAASLVSDRMLGPALVGTPTEVIEQIEGLLEAGGVRHRPGAGERGSPGLPPAGARITVPRCTVPESRGGGIARREDLYAPT